MPIETVSVKMPPNKTYALREAFFTRYTYEGSMVAGVLETLERAKPTTKPKSSRFLVYELKQDRGRRFRLVKPIDTFNLMEDTTYHVWLQYGHHSYAHLDMCDCTGNLGHGRCKHAEAIRALFNAGFLPSATSLLLSVPTPPKRSSVRTPSNPGRRRSAKERKR